MIKYAAFNELYRIHGNTDAANLGFRYAAIADDFESQAVATTEMNTARTFIVQSPVSARAGRFVLRARYNEGSFYASGKYRNTT